MFLLQPSFLHTADRFERMHPRGHLRRIYPLAERLKDMHDATHIANGGKKGSQSRMHCWYVFDRNYCGHATTIPVSINDPTARMPWQRGTSASNAAKPTSHSDRHRGSARKHASNRLIARGLA